MSKNANTTTQVTVNELKSVKAAKDALNLLMAPLAKKKNTRRGKELLARAGELSQEKRPKLADLKALYSDVVALVVTPVSADTKSKAPAKQSTPKQESLKKPTATKTATKSTETKKPTAKKESAKPTTKAEPKAPKAEFPETFEDDGVTFKKSEIDNMDDLREAFANDKEFRILLHWPKEYLKDYTWGQVKAPKGGFDNDLDMQAVMYVGQEAPVIYVVSEYTEGCMIYFGKQLKKLKNGRKVNNAMYELYEAE